MAAAVAIFCGVVWDLYPLPDARCRLERIPERTAQFAGSDLTLTEREKAALGRVNVVHRRYNFGDHHFYLTMIDATKNRHAVHDPRYCFQGAGWRIVAEKPMGIPGGEATWLSIARNEKRMEAIFWFSDGMARYSSFPRYLWETTLRRLTLGRSGAEPVMVVVQFYGRDQPAWPDFARQLVGALHL